MSKVKLQEVEVLEAELVQEELNKDERSNEVLVNDYTNRFLAHTKQANLLPDELTQKVEAMLPELQHNFITQTIWRTETEIRASVLNDKDFPTKAAKYHQAKLEQKVFFEQLLQTQFDYQKHQKDYDLKVLEIEEKELDIEDLKAELADIRGNEVSNHTTSTKRLELNIRRAEKELEKLHIELDEMSYGEENLKIQGRERVRELEIWSNIKDELNDGSFDVDNKDTDQLVSFALSYARKAYDAVTNGAGGDTAGYSNIMAQFESGIKSCIEKGLIDNVLAELFQSTPLIKFVDEYFGFGLEAMKDGQKVLVKDL